MRYLMLFCSIIVLFIFQGCSTKHVQASILPEVIKQKASVKSSTLIEKEEDTFDISEFEEEFEDETADISDPLSGYNKIMTSMNDTIIIYALNPISEIYAYLFPRPIREGIANAIHNIQFPIRFTNNLLQGKFQNVSDEVERFIVNSTVGVAGFMDPAKKYMNIAAHNEDFGQTLGYYGIDSGFHIVLPFFGPSNVRDVVGITVDGYLSPLVNIRGLEKYKIPDNFVQSSVIVTGYFINKNSLNLGAYESLKKDALDLYPFLRDIYEQKRISDIEE